MTPIIILFAVMLILLMLGFPVAFTLGGGAMLMGFIYFWGGYTFLNSIGNLTDLMTLKIIGVMDSQMLMAVPLFVFMGVMLEKSGLAEELLETMALLFGKLRGGMAIAVIIVGAILAASTGIVGATVVTMGLLSLPTMLRRGYSPEIATGTICASGTLGQIIPPSIVLILLASILQNTDQAVSIEGLFKAAFIPGLILVALYILWVIILTLVKPASVPAMPEEDLEHFRQGNMLKQVCTALLPPLILMILVLGSIFAGVATPTKAAAVGALGAGILTLCKKKFTYKTIKGVMAGYHLPDMYGVYDSGRGKILFPCISGNRRG